MPRSHPCMGPQHRMQATRCDACATLHNNPAYLTCRCHVPNETHVWFHNQDLQATRCDTVAPFTTTGFSSQASRHDACEPFHLDPAYL
jgi:hypothetical protein